MHLFLTDIGWLLTAVAFVGVGYTMLAATLVGRFMQAPQKTARHSPPVTILKPLHRCEPDLAQNLETFFTQTYDGPVQIIFGVHDESDPAIAVVHGLQAKYPQADTAIVADTALYGANAKVSNLINMLPQARHDILVLSDSDIAVGPLWLIRCENLLSGAGHSGSSAFPWRTARTR